MLLAHNIAMRPNRKWILLETAFDGLGAMGYRRSANGVSLMSPLVTIVIVPREQFSRARLSLQSVLDTTEHDCPIIYVDGNSPPDLARDLEAASDRLLLIRKDHYLPANTARNLALAHVRTRYVVFLDNDVLVWPGWIASLVKCAEETGAWVVGPLYCIGSPDSQEVHSAGADTSITEENGRRRIHELNHHCGKPAAEVRALVGRAPCDQMEFHCLLARTEAFDRIGPLDERLLVAFDHVDFCMAVRNANHQVYLESDATITYLAPPPLAWSDLPFFLLRWSETWFQSSKDHFCEKWQLDPGDAVFQDHENYRVQHRARMLTTSVQVNRFVELTLGKILEKTLIKNLAQRNPPQLDGRVPRAKIS
jgi:GT2 family glycosyltransferase